MDKEERKQWLFNVIQQLENDGLVDDRFRECYMLKDDSDSRFVVDLISTFFKEVRKVVKKMAKTLNQPLVDFDIEMNECCIKLKGSAACIGACGISGACSNLRQAIENNSKEGCSLELKNIRREFKKLRYRLNPFLRVELELISGNG